MPFQVMASSLALSLGLLSLLAIKWQIKLRIGVAGALAIGLATGLIVSWVKFLAPSLGLAALLPVEGLVILLLTGGAILFRFYRDPERTPPETRGVVLSPADGRVLYVRRIEEGAFPIATKGGRMIRLEELTNASWHLSAGYLVGIGMNLLNVHVNRAPVAGTVVLQQRTGGRFLSLRRPEAETLNERMTTVIDTGGFQVAVVQIASRLVRRIVAYVREGDRVSIAQRLGMIRFGSQVDLALPEAEDCQVTVRPGDEVRAGVSVIARYVPGSATESPGQKRQVRQAHEV